MPATSPAASASSPSPPEALQPGKISYEFALKAGHAVIYSSPAFTVSQAQSKATLALAQAAGVSCRAFVNGRPLAAGEFELQPGLNVVALEANGASGWVRPEITIGTQRLPADGRWLCSTAEPPADWQTALRAAGFTPAVAASKGLWCRTPSTGKVYFRRGVYVSPPVPRLFPFTDKVWLPVGSSQRLKPYLSLPPGHDSRGYRLCLKVPSYLRYVAADSIEGARPQAVEAIGKQQEGGRSWSLYRVSYGAYPGTGLDLSLCWGREGGSTIVYQPGLIAGGTFDWAHFTTTVRAPAGAAQLRPLVIKWQDRGITGTFWVDNITVRRKGSTEDLVKVGDFEGPQWTHSYIVKGEGTKGSRALRIVSTAASADQQQALWVPTESAIRVEAGAEYVVEMDARAENLVSPKARPLASLLFAVDGKAPVGRDRLWINCETDDGTITEAAQPVEIETLPPLLNVRPGEIKITPCYYVDYYSDPAVLAALAANFRRSGMAANYGGAENELVRLLRKQGPHWCILSFGYTPWQVPSGMPDPRKDRPEVRATEYSGKPSDDRLCPTWVLTEGKEVLAALEKLAASQVKGGLYQGVDWDVEDPVIDPPTYCFCPRCLEAFRLAAKLPAEGKLTAEMMTKEYRKQWTDFRCGQNAALAAHVRAGVKAASPGIEFSMYSGYQGDYTREHYGVDWSLLAPLLDLGVAGYNGDRKAIQDTIAALKPVPFMGGEMHYLSPTTESGNFPDPRPWRNRLLRQCVESGGVGVLIWYLPTMDGGAFYYTSEAAAVLARHEDLFHGGVRCEAEVKVEGLPANDWFALKRGDKRLVLLLNLGGQPATVKVEVPGRWRDLAVENPVSGHKVAGTVARPATVTLPAYGVRVLTATAPAE